MIFVKYHNLDTVRDYRGHWYMERWMVSELKLSLLLNPLFTVQVLCILLVHFSLFNLTLTFC